MPEQTQLIPQTTPLSTPRTKKTSPDQTTDGMPSMIDTQNIDEDRDSTPRLTPQPEERMPTTRELYSNQWEDNNREPEIIMESVPLLNGGPPSSWNELETIPGNVAVSTPTLITTTGATKIESASILTKNARG